MKDNGGQSAFDMVIKYCSKNSENILRLLRGENNACSDRGQTMEDDPDVISGGKADPGSLLHVSNQDVTEQEKQVMG